MNENPYEAPRLDEATIAQPVSNSNDIDLKYRGGLLGRVALGGIVVAVGIGLEIAVVYLITQVLNRNPSLGLESLIFVAYFGLPAIAWIAGIFALTKLLYPLSIGNSERLGIAILTMIPCYILFVPTCCCLSMVTDEVIPRFRQVQMYGPSFAALFIGTLLSFLFIFIPASVVLRSRMRKRFIRSRVDEPQRDSVRFLETNDLTAR
jgi:hypothetical protein